MWECSYCVFDQSCIVRSAVDGSSFRKGFPLDLGVVAGLKFASRMRVIIVASIEFVAMPLA